MNKRKIRILIIEDKYFFGMMLGKELKRLGVSSDWVRNGVLGVTKIEESNVEYDGIITDVKMPVMDGLEATKRIRLLGFTKPIIGFSSMEEEEDINRGLNAGMNGYLKKSAGLEAIRNLLDKLEILKKS